MNSIVNTDKNSSEILLNNYIKQKKIDIYQLETIIREYLLSIHPKHSNGFIIRLGDIEKEENILINWIENIKNFIKQ